jgi:hypothetical protein
MFCVEVLMGCVTVMFVVIVQTACEEAYWRATMEM